MTDADILAGLTDLFREVFDDPSIALSATTTADDIPAWDSMNHITIVVEAERRFGVKFQTAEIEEMKNVGDFVRLIGAKLAKRG
jgi:acyl carrier protein